MIHIEPIKALNQVKVFLRMMSDRLREVAVGASFTCPRSIRTATSAEVEAGYLRDGGHRGSPSMRRRMTPSRSAHGHTSSSSTSSRSIAASATRAPAKS